MARPARSAAPPPGAAPAHLTKKCPDCFAYLPLDADVCHGCGRPVGPVTPTGLARRPFNLKAYLAAAAAFAAFAAFVWWSFFSD